MNDNGDVKTWDAHDTGLTIAIVHQLGKTRNLSMQTSVPLDLAPEALNQILDKLHTALDRQEAKYTIEDEQDQLAQEQKVLEQFKEDVVHADERVKMIQDDWARNKKGPFRMPEKELNAKKALEGTGRRYQEAIKMRQAKIDKLRAKLNGAAAG